MIDRFRITSADRLVVLSDELSLIGTDVESFGKLDVSSIKIWGRI